MLATAVLLALQADAFAPGDFDKHIRFLASPEMKGRDNGTDEGRRAAQYVADRFKECGLKPGGKDGYFHDFSARSLEGRNVVGLLPGENAAEFVLVAAHHDARGIVGGKVQPGADDNASGVAMVLELARSFAGSKPKRSILFVSFDGEEDGMVGSREFVKSGLYDPQAIAAMFVFDLIGGDFMPWENNRIYALGSEYSAELFDRVGKDAADTKDLDVVRSGVALIEPLPDMARSDYHAFRGKGVPFVFFSTGTPWYYHTEHDTAERINLGKMVKAARFVRRVLAETAADEKRPVFRKPVVVEEDAKTVLDALDRVIAHEQDLKLTEKHRTGVKALQAELSTSKEADPKKLQQAMILLFSIARSQGKP
jgi:peptidase M28-like protein